MACPGDVTDLELWLPGKIMVSLFATPSSSLITRYAALMMGWKFPLSGYMFPQTNHLFSSEIISMCSRKSLCNREKY